MPNNHPSKLLPKWFLLSKSQLSTLSFEALWETVKDGLRDEPDDSAGLAGPGTWKQRETEFRSWVINCVDSGIGQRFWGPGTQGNWRFAKNKQEIVGFYRLLIMRCSKLERDRRKAKLKGKTAKSPTLIKARREKEDGLPEAQDQKVEVPQDEEYRDEAMGYATEVHDDSPAHGMGYQLLHIQIPCSTSEQKYSESTGTMSSDATFTPINSRVLRSSRKQVIQRKTLPLSKRPQALIPKDWVRRSILNRHSNYTPAPNEIDRVFKTRLGTDKIITHLFAPLTISFQSFFEHFCEAWRKSFRMGAEDVEVKVSIVGLGEYQVGFKSSREKGWSHIMKLAESRPESEILVTLEF